MPTLIMMCGLPGSGKSTYAENLKKEGYVVHSSDSIREELGDITDQSNNKKVFFILHKRIKFDLRNGKNVVYDATNLKRKGRESFLKSLKGIPCKKICVVVATPYEICISQNLKRDRKVPIEVIERMHNSFETPTCAEGFDDVIEHY